MRRTLEVAIRSGVWMVLAAIASLARGQTIVVGGTTYVNKGLVGVGRVPAAQRDTLGETLGSFSGMAIDLRTWSGGASRAFNATLYTQSDRGYTPAGATTNYRSRRQTFTLRFEPDYNGSSHQDQVTLSLVDTMLLTEATGTPLTSLDPTVGGAGTRPGFPPLPQAFNGRVSLDAEGIALLPDGTFFVCDEYGPYLYRFTAEGVLLGAIRPPEALIPKRSGGDSFSSNNPLAGQPAASPNQPTSGRENNAGFEGLSVSADARTLYALMQSATEQDGGSAGAGRNRYVRLLAYDIANPAAPALNGEWILPLPHYTDSNNVQRVAEQHELVALGSGRFLVLAHDSRGRGDQNAHSLYRAVLLYDLAGASNLAGTAFDSATTPVAPNGVLASGVVAATSAVLIDINTSSQLGKFGLNNNASDNSDTLAPQWESMALAPALDPTAPDDYFLFVGNDNNYATTNGFQDGVAYNSSPNIDSMVLAYRVTLPGTLFVPVIISHPSNTGVVLGQTATFTVTVSGNPTPSFQWFKNGVALPSSTGATLRILNAQAADAGAYSVVVTNANGSGTSASATLTVSDASVPAFVSQPVAQTIAGGGTVVFSAFANNATSYQWRKNGTAIAGETGRMLMLRNAAAADAGSYSVVATNAFGTTTSASASLTVMSVTPPDNSRLVNLSVLTNISDSDSVFTIGTVLGGAGTTGSKPLLIRAAGPSLSQFGITAPLPDPRLDVFSGQTVIASNDNWDGSTMLNAVFTAVGAFGYSSANSRDAAIYNPALASGGVTAQISAVGLGSGVVIGEIYDATPSAAMTSTTPRLVNLSVLKPISGSSVLTAGFVIGGSVAKTVLIRAIGPRLLTAPFNVSGAMNNPKLELFAGSNAIAANDNWGGEPQLSTAAGAVGAFAVTDPVSKDAMLLETLPPGIYSAQASSANGAGGVVILEIYEVP